MTERKEVKEAIQAADKALKALADAEKILKSAKNWGNYDTWFGGKIFSSMIKHQKVDQAEETMAAVEIELYSLQDELADIDIPLSEFEYSKQMDRFLDIAFDNVFSDWRTQQQIKANLVNIQNLQLEIAEILQGLKKY